MSFTGSSEKEKAFKKCQSKWLNLVYYLQVSSSYCSCDCECSTLIAAQCVLQVCDCWWASAPRGELRHSVISSKTSAGGCRKDIFVRLYFTKNAFIEICNLKRGLNSLEHRSAGQHSDMGVTMYWLRSWLAGSIQWNKNINPPSQISLFVHV